MCKNEEVRKALHFVSVSACAVINGQINQPALISITILNMDATKLLSGIVTPRNRIKHFKGDQHHLNTDAIVRQYGGYECRKDIKLCLDEKIFVGFKVMPEMVNLLGISADRVLGVRDLSTALCTAAKGFSATKGFSLNLLAKKYRIERLKVENKLWAETR